MPTRDSLLYAKLHTNKYVGKSTDVGGRVFPIMFEHVVIAGEIAADVVNLCKIPIGAMVVGLHFSSGQMWTDATVNGTLQLGDALDPDRFMTAIESYTVNGPIATDKPYAGLAATGQNWIATVETIVIATYLVATPITGSRFGGCFMVVLGE